MTNVHLLHYVAHHKMTLQAHSSGKRRNTKMLWTTKQIWIYDFFGGKCFMIEILRVRLNFFRSDCIIPLHPFILLRSIKVHPKSFLCYFYAFVRLQLHSTSDLLPWRRLRTADYLEDNILALCLQPPGLVSC